MPPAHLIWKCVCEVAKWRGVSENCGCQVAKWRCVSESRPPRRLPEAGPGGAQEAPELKKSLPKRAPGGPKIAKNHACSSVRGGAQKLTCYPPVRVTGCFFGPRGGGRLQREVSLRTSEFWRPDLGDLEAKNLDSLEDYSLVAKNRALNSLVAPQGGRRIL